MSTPFYEALVNVSNSMGEGYGVAMPFSPSMAKHEPTRGVATRSLLPYLDDKVVGYYAKSTGSASELYRRMALFVAKYPKLLKISDDLYFPMLNNAHDFIRMAISPMDGLALSKMYANYPRNNISESRFHALRTPMMRNLLRDHVGQAHMIAVELDAMASDVKAIALANLFSQIGGLNKELTGFGDFTVSGTQSAILFSFMAETPDQQDEKVRRFTQYLSECYPMGQHIDILTNDIGPLEYSPEGKLTKAEWQALKRLMQSSSLLQRTSGHTLDKKHIYKRFSKRFHPLNRFWLATLATSQFELLVTLLCLIAILLPKEGARGRSKVPDDPIDEEEDASDGLNWGEMEIVDLPKPGLATAVSKAGRAPAASDYGVIPRYPHRLYVDQAIFTVDRSKRPGGTILIDASGSMSWSNDEISRLAAACPNATVACYCGDSQGQGRLSILARNGRCASTEDIEEAFEYGSANEVDGPALDWLVKQRRPFIWVCDGHVTTAGDVPTQEAREYCLSLKDDYGIFQVRRLAEVEALLSGHSIEGIEQQGVSGTSGQYVEDFGVEDDYRLRRELAGIEDDSNA